MAATTTPYQIRLNIELRKRLADAATADDRPESRIIHHALAEYLDRRDAALAPPQVPAARRPAKRRNGS